MCPIVLRLMIAMYISQMMQVKWGGILSKQFPVGNGVKQGGVLSPVLFTVYLDNLQKKNSNSVILDVKQVTVI